MTTDNELYDERRSLIVTVTSWVYYKEYPNNHIQETTNKFPIEGKLPFINTRKQWISDSIKTVIDRLTASIIDEFEEKYYITAPAGKNDGSMDWNYKIIDLDFQYVSGKPEAPEFVLRTIIDLEERRDKAMTIKAKEGIQNMIDELKSEYEIE